MGNPIFSRDPIRLHISRFRELVPPRSLKPSIKKKVEPIGETNTCWIGYCPNCGKTLISAVTDKTTRPNRFECGICR